MLSVNNLIGFGSISDLSSISIDQYFNYVTMLLQGNGTNGAQNNTFLDGSTNNFTITRNGNTTQGSFGPYGDRWSNYFDGTGDFLTAPSNAAFAYGTGDFTWEVWIYGTPSTWTTGTFYILDHGVNGGLLAYYQNRIVYYNPTTGNGSSLYTAGGALSANAWNHIVACRASGTTRLFVNGVVVASASDTNNYTAQLVTIGNYGSGGYSFQGYISNLRIIKGTALYTANFTPPTGPLTAITNTSLLTCQSNRFIDNSSNNFTITRNGDVSVRPFNPFLPSAAYSASVNGGSGYWAGTTELAGLTLGNSLLGSSDFCIEFWVYIPDLATSGGTSTIMPLVGNFDWYNGATSASIFIAYDSGQFGFYLYTGAGTNVSSAPNSSVLTGASSAVLGMWHHIACTRSGATIKIYQNGVEKSSATLSSNTAVNFNTRDIYVGRNHLNNAGSPTASRYFKGYISDFRMVVGSTVYTGNFTPPSTPLTSITNTSRLLNFTNAGVIDSTADNVLETVGNAQISTSVKKYGTGSLAFDGSNDFLASSPIVSDMLAFGTGNFTIECWLYASALGAGQRAIYDQRPAGTNGLYPTIYVSNSILYFFTNSANIITGPTLLINTWYHIALCRSGTSTRLFVDGTQVGSTYTDSNNYINASGRPWIGQFSVVADTDLVANAGYCWNGYIDDLRVTKGFARYTANFTPPDTEFPRQ